MAKDLKGLHENGDFSDVILQVEDKQFHAHKAVLACRSKVFGAMFKHELKESQTNTVEIKDMEPATMISLLQYIYTGNIDDFSVEKAQALFSAADKYCLEELAKHCVEFMLANLTIENVCQMAVLANMHSESRLKFATIYMFRKYKHEIFQRQEWKDLIGNGSHLALATEILQAITTDFTTDVDIS